MQSGRRAEKNLGSLLSMPLNMNSESREEAALNYSSMTIS